MSLCLCGCTRGGGAPADGEVVVYSSLDRVYSEPILHQFERETGIRVRALYDLEASKTTGLVNRLIEERARPQADVFWNSELVRTLILKRKGVLVPYRSPSAAGIPAAWKDRDGYWTGFAARARVIVYNNKLVKADQAPRSVFDLTGKRWRGKVAVANPLFGTTATHAAALWAVLGPRKAEGYFQALKANRAAILDGNAMVRDQVARGEFLVGLTDTDDVWSGVRDGKPVAMVYPDQGRGQSGALVIPNTVAKVAGGPHPEHAERLIDWLLRPQIEAQLAAGESHQMPVRAEVRTPPGVRTLAQIKAMTVTPEQLAASLEPSQQSLQELFVR